MKPYIKYDRWGDPVCCDCEHAFLDGERAMIADNEVICWDCVEKWAEDCLEDLLDHIDSGDAKMISEFDLDELIESDRQETADETNEELERIMRSDD